MAKTVLKSKVTWDHEGVRSIADIQGKQFIIDEPKPLGGTDQGPTPIELILSAMGGCLTILIASLAKSHGVELNDVIAEIEGDFDPDGFLEKDINKRTGFTEIRYKLTIDSPSPKNKIEELIEHAERICPVKDTLKGVSLKKSEVNVLQYV